MVKGNKHVCFYVYTGYPYYTFHPQCRVSIKSESRLKMTEQEAEQWQEKLSMLYYN